MTIGELTHSIAFYNNNKMMVRIYFFDRLMKFDEKNLRQDQDHCQDDEREENVFSHGRKPSIAGWQGRRQGHQLERPKP